MLVVLIIGFTRAGSIANRAAGYRRPKGSIPDYAPPGDLSGGPCDPVFKGPIAFGIAKGGNSAAFDGTPGT